MCISLSLYTFISLHKEIFILKLVQSQMLEINDQNYCYTKPKRRGG